MPTISERFRNGWNAFMKNKDPAARYQPDGHSSFYRPDRPRFTRGNDRSIVTAVYNRMAMDVAAVDIHHVRLDADDHFLEVIKSPLDDIFTLEANIDQTGRAFVQDIAMSLFDEGCVALVPVDTDRSVIKNNSFDILSIRTAQILEWFPRDVRVRVYNDRTGLKEDLILPKESIAIVENPFYSIMNEPNSTAKRLTNKLALLDFTDDQNSSGKLDLIIQLPYVIKSEARRQQAEQRRKEIETQLTSSKYGIAYTDGTEHITQLNRPVENTLLDQVRMLKDDLFAQLGITQAILNGTASPEEMQNYYSRAIEPVLSAIILEVRRKFLTKTARTQGQSVLFFRDPFKLIPVDKIAEITDKMTRNEVMSSNEVRSVIGLKPSSDPAADELRNKNLNQSNEEMDPQQMMMPPQGEITDEDVDMAMADYDAFDAQLDDLEEAIKNA